MIPIRWNELKQNASIMGANQEGKSTLAKEIVKELVSAGRSVIIYAEHPNFDDLNPACIKHNIFDLRGQGLEIFRPYIATDELFVQFIEAIYAKFGYCVVVLDEIHNRVTKHNIPKSVKIFVENCNNKNIGFIATFHSPSEVNNAVLRTSQIKFVFNMDLPRDIEYAEKWIDPMAKGFSDGTIAQYQGICKKRHEKAVLFSL